MVEDNFKISSHVFPSIANGVTTYYGFTTRELFAAMAMQGLLGAQSLQVPVDDIAIAIDAVALADALIRELAK